MRIKTLCDRGLLFTDLTVVLFPSVPNYNLFLCLPHWPTISLAAKSRVVPPSVLDPAKHPLTPRLLCLPATSNSLAHTPVPFICGSALVRPARRFLPAVCAASPLRPIIYNPFPHTSTNGQSRVNTEKKRTYG